MSVPFAASHKVLLLQLIRARDSAALLFAQGLTASQIAALMQELNREGLIEERHGTTVLTRAGIRAIETLQPAGKKNWIRAAEEFRRPQQEPFAAFLPRYRSKLDFDKEG